MVEVAEEVEQQDGGADAGGEGEGGVAVAAPPTKPKKGKAALLLKRDRVCLKIAFFMIFFINYFACWNGFLLHFMRQSVRFFLEFCIVASSVSNFLPKDCIFRHML